MDPDDLDMMPGVRELEAKRQAVLPSDTFEVDYDNWPAYVAFLSLSTQWRLAIPASMDGARPIYLGLDYAGVYAFLKATKQINLFSEIQCLEQGALMALNNRQLPKDLE